MANAKLHDELQAREIILMQSLNKKQTTRQDKIMAGAQLSWIHEHFKKLPELMENYETIADYAEDKIGYAKSTTWNLISVAERFCITDKKKNPTGVLKPCFQGFDYSKLVEMQLITDDETLAKITPDMSVRKIKELRKGTPALTTITCPKDRKELHALINGMTDEQCEIMMDFANRLIKI